MLVFLLMISSGNATDFFDGVEQVPNASPPPVYKAFYDIAINFDELQDGPDSLTFNLPNGINTTVNLTEFAARQGYQYFDEDEDPPGTPPFWIPAGTPHEEIGYKWSGSNDDYDVLISVHNGILIGIITGNNFRYGMSRTTTGDYRMFEFDYDFFPPTDILESTGEANNITDKNNQSEYETYVTDIKTFDFSNHYENETRNSTTVLDVLILWTEDARVEAGGVSGDPSDTDDIEALMVASIDHANTALSNSSMNTRLTRFHTAKYNNFVYTGSFRTDLKNLKDDPAIKTTRNQVGADTVIAIIGSDFNQFQACGVAYVQTFPGCSQTDPVPNCNVGIDFKESSYAISTEFCAIWDDTFTHELGHNMGANHVQDELPSGWETGVVGNGYPDAFGHRVSTFKSIMSISGTTTARRLNFSNPSVQVNGNNTGVLNSRNNARIIDLLTPAMSGFNIRPDLIFENGFE